MKKTAVILLAAASLILSACGTKPAAEASAVTENDAEITEAQAAETQAQTEVTAAETTAAAVETTAAETSAQTETAEEETGAAALVPADRLDCQYVEDKAFVPSDYRSLAKFGNFTEEMISQLMEGVSDLFAFDFAAAGLDPEFYYGDTVTQMVIDSGSGTEICSATVYTGNELLDGVMKKNGYGDYEVQYYYTFGIWADPEAEPAPVMAEVYIEDDLYSYYFADGMLVRREAADGETDNPETNEFMDMIYKVGCYYGKHLAVEKGRYSLFIYAPDYVVKDKETVKITADIAGNCGTYVFTVDKDTKFSDDCELEFFEDIRKGETPLEWYIRMIETSETGTALVGVLDVKTEGTHIDTIFGNYWWD